MNEMITYILPVEFQNKLVRTVKRLSKLYASEALSQSEYYSYCMKEFDIVGCSIKIEFDRNATTHGFVTTFEFETEQKLLEFMLKEM